MIIKARISSLFKVMILLPMVALCQNQLHLIATMSGDSLGDLFQIVAGVGDMNGDGYDDILVGAPGGNYAKLFFGGPTFDTTHYVKLVGDQKGSQFGYSVAGGDVNGDGYADIIIGAPYYSIGGPNGIAQAGKVYVYFGGPSFDTIPDLTFAPGSWYYNFGSSVCIARDVNGDGYTDIVVGAPNDDIDGHGRVYIYYGGPSMDNIPDVLLEGTENFDFFGSSVAGVGDVNKDGYGDLIIGAPQFGRPHYYGKAYLLYGGQTIGLSNSTCFVGDSTAYGHFGQVVTGLGDVNNDGFPDFGIMGYSKVNLYLGNTQIDTIPKITIYSRSGFGYLGNLGDLNKDGFNDFVAVSDSVRIYFGAAMLDTIPDITLSWATPICYLGNVNSDQYIDIAYAIGGGWDPRGKVYIYSYEHPDNVDENGTNHPKKLALEQNYPNPFNPNTVISYQLPGVGTRYIVSLKVFDILGREIRTLVDGIQKSGEHTITFNASGLSSGVYFYRLTAGHYITQKPMLLLK